MKSRIGVLMGGTSPGRDVSIRSGRAVQRALEEAGRDAVPILVDRAADVVRVIEQARIGSAFVALPGNLGEGGCIQGMLEFLGVPYTGSGVMATALAADKVKAKELFRLHNVPTPPYYAIERAGAQDLEDVHGSFGFPVVVKPRREGSGAFVTKAKTSSELAVGLERALEHDGAALVERFIAGREVHVALLDGRVLGAIEVVPKGGMYDHSARHFLGGAEFFYPARLPATRYRGVLNLAERAAQALDTTSAVSVTLLVTEGQNEYVLGVDTLPILTPTSLFATIAASVGFEFAALCAAVADRARLHSGVTTEKAVERIDPVLERVEAAVRVA